MNKLFWYSLGAAWPYVGSWRVGTEEAVRLQSQIAESFGQQGAPVQAVLSPCLDTYTHTHAQYIYKTNYIKHTTSIAGKRKQPTT